MGNHLGTRWRGKLPIPEHAHPLVRHFFRLLNKHRTVISEVAPRASLASVTISDWRYRRNPTLPTFEAALNAIGYELYIRPMKND